ncbi:tail fiber protein [Crocosphaera sp. XPORK-15E]|uniref:tail fiber protein n=1 Tax=Crocosphaera sp. XPORK-15E TaxID=3110247 RepID=UPI002B2104B2|nr:tail fiber protein [Crocosphaera sp. XPORK-15E]MEA5534662.1 tail fiber protein [Crocosphaera sp. XPORK-15E]
MAMIGEIKLWGGEFAPKGWRFCDGSKLEIWSAQPLASILGNNYRSLGGQTFELPNLEPVQGVRYIICLEGEFPEKA